MTARVSRVSGMRARSISRYQCGDGGEPHQHGERPAMGCAGIGHQRHQPGALALAQRIVAQQQQIECEHGEPGKNVGEQDGREPRQSGEQAERGDDGEQQQRPVAQALRAQGERQHPDGERRLHDRHRPEIRPLARHQQQAIGHRAVDQQLAFVPGREIGAGVVLQQRETVPDRRRQQQRHAGKDDQRPHGAAAVVHSTLPGAALYPA